MRSDPIENVEERGDHRPGVEYLFRKIGFLMTGIGYDQFVAAYGRSGCGPIKAVFGEEDTGRITRLAAVIKFVEKEVAKSGNSSHKIDVKWIAKHINKSGGIAAIVAANSKTPKMPPDEQQLIRNIQRQFGSDPKQTFAKVKTPPANSKDGDLGLVLVRVKNGAYEILKSFDVFPSWNERFDIDSLIRVAIDEGLLDK